MPRGRQPTAPRHRLAIACGGTAGHVYPALVVADLWRRSRGEGAVFFVVPAQGLAARLVAAEGHPIEPLDSLPLLGASPGSQLKAVLCTARGVGRARRILAHRQAGLAVGFGGFATAAPLLAARCMGLGTAIHESNATAGLANRLLARLVDRVFTAFEPAAAGLPAARVERTGTPVRREILRLGAERRGAGTRGDRPAQILVTGGSLGSEFLNRRAPDLLARAARRGVALTVRHQCGDSPPAPIAAAYAAAGIAAAVDPYLDDMPGAYTWADFAIACAGAGTVFELAAAAVPSLFVPLAGAAHDHQTHNAAAFTAASAGWWAAEAGWQPEAWADRLAGLLADPAALDAAAARARRCVVPDAAERVLAACEDLLATPRHDAMTQ